MKLIYVCIPILALVFACGGSTDGPVNYTVEAGQKVFKKYCMSCHGMDGKMQMNGAKDLSLSQLTYSERVQLIKLGKGAMTPFGNILSEEEIANAAKFSMKFQPAQ